MDLRNKRGVTMISLVVTIIVMIVVTTAIVYRTKNQVNLQKYDALQSDIMAINNAIQEYYLKNNDVPVICEYATKENLELIMKSEGVENVFFDSNDEGKYYVIDLGKLDNLTLNFGQDYKEIKKNIANVTQYKDVYVINLVSHKVYYPKCVKANDVMYYTDYIENEVILYQEINDV